MHLKLGADGLQTSILMTIPIEEVTKSKNEDTLKYLSSFGSKAHLEGMYTAIDPSVLELSGTVNDFTTDFISLTFIPCQTSGSLKCAPDEEIQIFLASHVLIVEALTNFIDMEEVLPAGETLKSINKAIVTAKVDLEKP